MEFLSEFAKGAQKPPSPIDVTIEHRPLICKEIAPQAVPTENNKRCSIDNCQ
jgi:hypothetical protein